MEKNILWASIASVGTWGFTALGAAVVLFFKSPKQRLFNIMLGFSAGVMIASSFWSLLQPAIERAEEFKTPPYIIVTIGFLSGSLFIWISDKIATKIIKKTGKTNSNRITMLILSITLHNIPEGLAVGVAFGLLKNNYTVSEVMGAISIALGIALQNFPEGAAVSLPLRREGYTRRKSFICGQLSAVVEPVAAVIGAALVSIVEIILPFALSFAAGAMIIVAVNELIPESQKDQLKDPYTATWGFISGFVIMMLLDVMFI